MFSKNWKSTLAFLIFVCIYAFSYADGANSEKLHVTGFFAIIAMALMMIRSDKLVELIKDFLKWRKDK